MPSKLNCRLVVCSSEVISHAHHLFLSSCLSIPTVCNPMQSIEIQRRVGAYSAALETTNKCLSEAICSLVRGRSDGERRTEELVLSGNDIINTYKYHPEVK